MFSLKAPLVEDIVRWKMNMYSGWRSLNPESMSRNDMRQEYLRRQFEMRRDLWTKPLQWLKAEIERNNTDRFLLGQAASVR